jgi:5,6,7,8-tetrahydromethanopterin hydro-lyase
VAAFVTQLGEAFCGTGAEAAHVNTVLGAKGGPVEAAWVTALATPRKGHAAFVVATQPGVAAKPMTLFVNKATIDSDAHAALTWGPAQAGVASGVLDAVADGTIAAALCDELVLVVAVWLSRDASDADAVYGFNREATHASLRAGALGLPTVGEALAVRDEPFNAYWLPPSMR